MVCTFFIIQYRCDFSCRRIAGLGAKKAEAIIEWRDKNGPFINRRQLMSVKGLGQKCFEQCAGFVRVVANETHLGEGSSTEVSF